MTSIAVTILRDPPDEFAKHLRILDEMGIESFAVGDSPSHYYDVWIRASLVALNTKRMRIGTWCTNPILRHPIVTASCVATIDELSGGRAFVGIGPGDSAVYDVGLKPAKLDGLEAYIRALRGLLEEGSAEWQGAKAEMDWVKRRIPIGVPASGPRALRMAGRTADVVLVANGIDSASAGCVLEEIDRGAREAGRSLDDIEIWWGVVFNPGDSHEAAIERLKPTLARQAYLIFRFTLEGKGVPPRLEKPIRRFVEEYNPADHGGLKPGGEESAAMIDRLGLTEFLADRLAIAGPIEDCLERVRDIRRHGVGRIYIPIARGLSERMERGLRQLVKERADPGSAR